LFDRRTGESKLRRAIPIAEAGRLLASHCELKLSIIMRFANSQDESAKMRAAKIRLAAISLLIGGLAFAGLLFYPAGAPLQAQGDKPRPAAAALQASFVPAGDRQSCAKQARQQFEDTGWNTDSRAHYIDHYNERWKTCFVEVEKMGVTGKGWTYVYKTVGDAEGREYADYMWGAYDTSADVPPSICRVILSSGEEIECHSSYEFDELAKEFMQ
jgi:hypothetical protein